MFPSLSGSKKGISIIEILVVIGIIGIAFATILGLASRSLRISTLVKETILADNLAREAVEQVRNFRDGTDWSSNGLGTLTTGVDYYPRKTIDIPPKWTLVLGQETIGNFKRKVIFNEVQRDAYDNIVESGGSNDPNTRKVTAIVSWPDKEVRLITYLTNWK